MTALPAAPPTPLRQKIPHRSVWLITAILAAFVLLNFAIQYPADNVADWRNFAVYDPGTVFKADALLSKGYLPTIDFGYTHGLLPLLYARIGFAILGHAPQTYLLLTLLAELVMAWSIARIFSALQLRVSSQLIFLAGIPFAIMPAYLTLTHPLEAMLILLALADQAERKLPRSLAILTVCLFVKPSMAYVYGFLLTLLILRQNLPHLSKTLRSLIPAGVTFITLALGLAAWLGIRPVINTLIPFTGAKTYAASGFGFFSPQGREFWQNSSINYYLFTPAGIFLLAAIAIIIGSFCLIPFLLKSPANSTPSTDSRRQLLITIAILHTTFILAFYGWTGSWTYYSYLPLLGLVILVDLLKLPAIIRPLITAGLITLVILSQTKLAGAIWYDWKFKQHASNGLYVYSTEWHEWHETLDAAQPTPKIPHPHTLIMTIGWIQNLPPNTQLIDAWFPETGIPTPSEIARVKKQADAAYYILIWNQYGPLDLFNAPAFAPIRNQFQPALVGNCFTLYQRIPSTSETRPSETRPSETRP